MSGVRFPIYPLTPIPLVGAVTYNALNVGVRGYTYGICCPWVHWGWGLDGLGNSSAAVAVAAAAVAHFNYNFC